VDAPAKFQACRLKKEAALTSGPKFGRKRPEGHDTATPIAASLLEFMVRRTKNKRESFLGSYSLASFFA
jgi:hypothetical protein